MSTNTIIVLYVTKCLYLSRQTYMNYSPHRLEMKSQIDNLYNNYGG